MLLASQVGRPKGDPLQRFMPPVLHELRGAGTKEEEADAVLTVYRPLRRGITALSVTTGGTMSEPITLHVPMPLNRANARGHSLVANITKKQYWAMLDELQQYGMLPVPPRQPIPRAAITSTMYLGAWMDDDNAVARHKIVLDWLVTRGYLVGDRKKHLRWTGFPTQIVRRTHEYRIALTLTPEDQ